MFSQRRKERGAVLVLAAALILVLIGVAALAVDLGQLHIARQRAQNVCDASALAGAWYLEPAGGAGQVIDIADELAITNNGLDNRKVLDPGTTLPGVRVTFPDGPKSVTIEGAVVVNFGFAKLLGFDSSRAMASATASLEANKGFSYKFVPLGVTDVQVRYPSRDPVTGMQKLSTPFWYTGTHQMGQASNLFPVVFGGGSYSPTDYQNLLMGSNPPFSLSMRSQIAGIRDDVVLSTRDSLNSRMSDDTWAWSDWNMRATDEQKLTSDRILMLPVIHRNSDGTMRLVGFTGFFVETVQLYQDTDSSGAPRYRMDMNGHFVPGVNGIKSMRWLRPYEDTTRPELNPFRYETNLIYRVRLTR